MEEKSCMTGVMMTPALQAEWRKHASRLMTAWLVVMEQRGRVRRSADRRVADLRAAILDLPDPGIRAELEKDLHLSEVAIMHGVPVMSLDDKQRRFLRDLAETYAASGRIQWVNPHRDDVALWTDWLLSGCVDRSQFCTRDC